jgi:hypothetical protein
MPTISNEFSEIYGTNGPLNFRKDPSINNLAKNIVPNKEFTNNVSKNMNTNVSKNMNTNVAKNVAPNTAPSSVATSIPWGIILFIVIILIGIGIIYYYKDRIYGLFDKIYKIDDVDKKTDDMIKKYEDDKIEQSIKEHEAKEHSDKAKEEKGGVNELNTKINSITSYKDQQKSKGNEFCYIGYDNGQRECTNVFDGDICMSGQLFPTMDVCINPHLRS